MLSGLLVFLNFFGGGMSSSYHISSTFMDRFPNKSFIGSPWAAPTLRGGHPAPGTVGATMSVSRIHGWCPCKLCRSMGGISSKEFLPRCGWFFCVWCLGKERVSTIHFEAIVCFFFGGGWSFFVVGEFWWKLCLNLAKCFASTAHIFEGESQCLAWKVLMPPAARSAVTRPLAEAIVFDGNDGASSETSPNGMK